MNKLVLIFIVVLFACNSQTNNKLVDVIKVAINKDSTILLISGLDPFILKELEADSLSEKDWQQNVSVYPQVEEDLQDLQKPILGKYKLTNNVIIFEPLQRFQKGKNYVVEIYLQNPNTDVVQQLKPQNSPFKNQYIKKVISF
ncbi:hypothetical protein [Pedobacter cryophilus]|uniref:Uncharacterized protein n=1 Tax=Pedobacter cryophilus TaxID=2571271 RepID=A0A4U1C5A7_9SPHI|nr:hypothetical protein [Pedobacter cryophilus]TKC00603.1 hypothetical protein FA046_02685 [Pedobacter cryophilus]